MTFCESDGDRKMVRCRHGETGKVRDRERNFAPRKIGAKCVWDSLHTGPLHICSYLATYLSIYLPTYLSTYLPTYLTLTPKYLHLSWWPRKWLIAPFPLRHKRIDRSVHHIVFCNERLLRHSLYLCTKAEKMISDWVKASPPKDW